ncbi:MAG: deoxyribodipyrimidine photolyase [Firmicutes bacterium]|nr:deoxyribodipyrimidine photolyase [Bacillota bacterium]
MSKESYIPNKPNPLAQRKVLTLQERVRLLQQGQRSNQPILYWMFRDQRPDDNWALLFAQKMALDNKESIHVLICFESPCPLSRRQYEFMAAGLKETELALRAKNISFTCVIGDPATVIPKLIIKRNFGCLVTDFSPLRQKKQWNKRIADTISIPFYEVDAHNIVPCWLASPKQEYAAYTLRPKLHRVLKQYLIDFPQLLRHPYVDGLESPLTSWERIQDQLSLNEAAQPVHWLAPGSREAYKTLLSFLETRLSDYHKNVNNPAVEGQSQLSPYLHFGQLAPQRVVLELLRHNPMDSSTEKFLEQIVIRRELADNYCLYNQSYDHFSGFPSWGQETLRQHAGDNRPYLYSQQELENHLTHDPLWNAAQLEMVENGKMNGYVRMYWAKKILEWTANPEEALAIAIYLNNLYELDGNDPIGYANMAWCIGGVHDRPWPQRPIFGKIRYMNYAGMRRKFNINEYINRVLARKNT